MPRRHPAAPQTPQGEGQRRRLPCEGRSLPRRGHRASRKGNLENPREPARGRRRPAHAPRGPSAAGREAHVRSGARPAPRTEGRREGVGTRRREVSCRVFWSSERNTNGRERAGGDPDSGHSAASPARGPGHNDLEIIRSDELGSGARRGRGASPCFIAALDTPRGTFVCRISGLGRKRKKKNTQQVQIPKRPPAARPARPRRRPERPRRRPGHGQPPGSSRSQGVPDPPRPGPGARRRLDLPAEPRAGVGAPLSRPRRRRRLHHGPRAAAAAAPGSPRALVLSQTFGVCGRQETGATLSRSSRRRLRGAEGAA